MPSDFSPNIPESGYPPLEKPEIKSTIPSHLLESATPAEKHIMGELSKLSSFADWSIQAHLSTHQQVRKTNGRLLRAEGHIEELKDSRTMVIRGWKLIAAIGVIIGSVAGLVSTLISILGSIAPK